MNPDSPYVLSRDNVAGGLAAAITTIVVWALNKYAHADIDATIGMSIGAVVYFLVTHFVPNQPAEPKLSVKAP